MEDKCKVLLYTFKCYGTSNMSQTIKELIRWIMFITTFKKFEKLLIISGVQVTKYEKLYQRFEVCQYRLLYSIFLVVFYNVVWFLKHYRVFINEGKDSEVFMRWLYRLDTTIWTITTTSFMINNILQRKIYVKILNKINTLNYNILGNTDARLKQKVNICILASFCYLIPLLIVNITATQEILLTKNSSIFVTIAYTIMSCILLLCNLGYEFFLIYKIYLNFAALSAVKIDSAYLKQI